jgi:hypothetical protein
VIAVHAPTTLAAEGDEANARKRPARSGAATRTFFFTA